jgi:hypothetical protein
LSGRINLFANRAVRRSDAGQIETSIADNQMSSRSGAVCQSSNQKGETRQDCRNRNQYDNPHENQPGETDAGPDWVRRNVEQYKL